MSRSGKLRVEPSDDVVDHVIRRGQNAGGPWIIASVVVFAAGFVLGTQTLLSLASLVGIMLFSIGLTVRVRYWRHARADLGEYALRRGQWRRAEREKEDPRRLIAALMLTALVIAFRLWK